MTKKVLMVIASLGGGGAERVAAQLANFFYEKKYDVKICYWHDKKNKYEIANNVKLNKINSKFRVFNLSREIKKFNPHVILSFTDVSNVIAYTAKLLARSSAKLVTTIHSDLKFRDQNIDMNYKVKALKVLHRHSCKNSEKVVVVSKGARNSFIEYYNIKPEKCISIYNPVHFNIKIDSLKNNIPAKSELLKIISIGRLTQAKNYPLLLDVAKKLKALNFSFLIHIYGEGELRSQLEGLIEEKGLMNNVILKGFTSNVEEIFTSYDLFVMTSSWEGFGNVLIEALGHGLPIISTDCPSGPREVLSDGEFGSLVQVNNSDEIVELIVARQYQKILELTKLEEHLNQFTLENIGEQYLSLINEICEQ